MKKLVILAAFAASLVSGSLRADPAARLAAFNKATGNGSNLMVLPAFQTWTSAVPELVAAGWTDDAVIATRNAAPILWAVEADGGMTEAFANKLAASLTGMGGTLFVPLASQTFVAVPVAYRQPFEALYKTVIRMSYPKQPVRSALLFDQAMAFTGYQLSVLVTANSAAVLSKATVEELVALRLAPEPRPSDEAALILAKATAVAKKQLRKEGRSFVTKDGVNPLADKMKPVVEALNAPLMTGIEGALAGCGISVTSQNGARAALAAAADRWRDAVLDGEVAPGAQAPYLNALKVSMGISNYNQFVDSYNNGALK